MKRYTVTGMSCAACSARVEKMVRGVSGVTECSVNLLTGDMGVEGDVGDAEIITAVEKAGYGALPKSDDTLPFNSPTAQAPDPDVLIDRQTPALLGRLIASVIFLLLLMTLSMGGMVGIPLPSILADHPAVQGLAQLLLSGAVLIIGQRFFVSGTKALLRGSPNMDTLVALGAAAAFGYSTFALFAMLLAEPAHAAHYLHELYFESAAMIVTLITVGKMLEAHAKGKTTDAIKGLMKLSPKTATLLREGKEVTVSADRVQVGDLFVVRPGESIPVDGVVTEGEGAVNESALTGESIPVDKAEGDTVCAASINQSGYLLCRATRVGQDTTLSRIIRAVEEASATKAPIAKLADRVSAIFVPTVLILALLTAVIWLIAGKTVGWAIARAISVLVISCPCALGLATPVAIMVGSGVGARSGILFKTAAALEAAGRIHTVALDKTGTITEGLPRVTDLIPAPDVTEQTLLSLAYALEHKSEHPLAHAICEEAEARGMTPSAVDSFRALPGNGLEAMASGARLIGGNRRFLEGQITLPENAIATAERLSSEGKTPLFFALGEKLLGIIAVADTVKQDSAEAIARLHDMGLRVVMLTGDNRRTAAAIAARVGIGEEEVLSDILPSDKEEAIRRLSEEGRGVAMVGDGINDAPALTRADLGIAIGAGTDIAIDAADAVLMKSDLSDVPAALYLGRKTLKNIRENLFWAFFYNVIGIPLAAGAFIPFLGWEMNPMFGAAAMSLSSFCVVSNALRLNLIRLHPEPKEQDPAALTLRVKGMMCEHCENRVTAALLALPFVASAKADHKSGRVTLSLRAPADNAALKKAIGDAGYRMR